MTVLLDVNHERARNIGTQEGRPIISRALLYIKGWFGAMARQDDFVMKAGPVQ